jgi:hypothetical protein
MISTKDLRAIARARLRDAQVLLNGKRFDGAFYLSGYAVELALKARICRTLKWPDFPRSGREFEDFRSLRTHSLEVLLKFSGVAERVTARHAAEWAVVVRWDPEKRYQAIGALQPDEAEQMVKCVEEASAGSVITVDVFRKAMHYIVSNKGDLTLYALFKRANGIGEWDLAVSAPWLPKSRYEAASELVDLIVKSIGRKSLVGLARIEPIPNNDPNLKSLLAEFPVDDGEPERRMRNVELFGLEMEQAIILRAKRPVTKKPARRVLQRAS